jgi:hypothetical protein
MFDEHKHTMRSAAGQSVTRRAAGRDASMEAPGTVLILVLGILALLAVITAVYAAIGSADRRTGDSVRRAREIDDVSDQVVDHIGTVLSKDVLAVDIITSSKFGANTTEMTRREATDYPFTDWTRQSVNGGIAFRFDPEGTFNTGSSTVNRVSSDPWLASTEPEYVSLSPAQDDLSTAANPDDWFLNNRDWKHISNIAPDGRYVNLFNLRPQGVGFDAPSRHLSGIVAVGDTVSALDLEPPSLLTWDNSDPSDAPEPTNQLRVSPTVLTPAVPNIPAHFSNNQRFAFRPMAIKDGLDWQDPEYIKYQWADADGDGFADSRFQELVDETDPKAPRRVVGATSSDLRWFVAARIVDLSSMVNVNTATDGLLPPSYQVPAGSTPAEVDLRRLLMLSDFEGAQVDVARSMFAGFRQPVPAANDSRNDLSKYLDIESPFTPWASLTGAYAYAGIGRTILDSRPASPEFDASNDFLYPSKPTAGGTPIVRNWLGGRFQRGATAPSGLIDVWNGQLDRLYSYQGRGGEAARRIFGETDLAELLTYRMSNDPSVTSSLEAAADARGVRLVVTSATSKEWLPASGYGAVGDWPDTSPITSRFSPLRSSRDLAFERSDRVTDLDFFPGGLIAGTEPTALLQSEVDPRQRLTTLSGHRPIKSTVGASGSSLSSGELTLDVGTLAAGLREPSNKTDTTKMDAYRKRKNRVVGDLYRGYANALMFADDELGTASDWAASRAWPDFKTATASTNYARYRTLFYGYNGPELPINLAAHLAVNMVDSLDTDDEPSVYTLIIDRTARGDLNTDGANVQVSARTYKWSSWGRQGQPEGRRLDLGEIPDPNATDPFAPAISGAKADRKLANGQTGSHAFSSVKNIYGLEIFPVVTDTAMLTVFVDMPPEVGGDNDQADPLAYPSIRGEANYAKDLGLRVVAFQLHNPFGKPIYLTAPGKKNVSSSESEALYYIQYGGRTYKVCDQKLDAVTGKYTGVGDGSAHDAVALEPGETRWFYYVNRRIDELESRWDKASGFMEPKVTKTGKMVRDFIRIQLGGAMSGGEPAQLVEFTPTNGKLRLIPANSSLSAGGTNPTTDIVSGDSAEDGVVRLWRVFLDGTDETVTTNALENDILIDRLRIPTTDRFAQSLDSKRTYTIDDKASEGHAKRGYTLVLAHSVRRPDDNSSPGRGGLPAFLLEVKSRDGTISLNKGEKNYTGGKQPENGLTAGDFRGGITGSNDTFRSFVAETIGGASGGATTKVVTAITEEPGQTRGSPQVIGVNKSAPVDAIGSGGQRDIRPILNLSNDLAARTVRKPDGNDQDLPEVLRVSDLLMPLAIGAEYDPDRATGAAVPDDARWTTLGEALAIALDYDGRPNTDPAATGAQTVTRALPGAKGGGAFSAFTDIKQLPNPYYRVGHRNPSNADESYRYPRLDSGRLVLNDFTPFLNFTNPAAANVLFEPNITNPQSGDQVRGLGIPAALNVLSEFRTLRRNVAIKYDQATDSYEYVDSSTNENPRLGHAPVGDLFTPVFGTVNINTAPVSVLRLLPMVSPTQTLFADGPYAGNPEWWGEYPTNLRVTDRSADIASRIVAYRDKLLNYQARTEPKVTGVAPPRRKLTYADTATTARLDVPASQNGRRGRLDAALTVASPELRPAAVREQPGFGSIGELMVLTDRKEPGVPGFSTTTPDKTSIDYLAKDGFNITSTNVQSGAISADGVMHTKLTGTTTSILADSSTDDYAERLAVAAALTNVVSVRSDYYACWFVLQGYRRAEVNRLGVDDPLIPAISRRFLVIFDRSNVVTSSDKPRIVLYKELPM